MLMEFIVIAIIVAAIIGLPASRHAGGLITRRPYNNVHSDATAARDGRLE